MPTTYLLEIDDLEPIKVTKKRGMRSIRMRITADGNCAVSAPWYVPRTAVLAFVMQRKAWIQTHTEDKSIHYRNGMQLANGMTLRLETGVTRNSSKLNDNTLLIRVHDGNQKAYIERTIIKYMTIHAEHELLPRLHELSTVYMLPFNQAYIKRVTSRWGSCDSQKNIILNVYLIQMPEAVRDYVMLHELSHTVHMNHSKEFWSHLERRCPDYKKIKKLLKEYDPKIYESNTLMA